MLNCANECTTFSSKGEKDATSMTSLACHLFPQKIVLGMWDCGVCKLKYSFQYTSFSSMKTLHDVLFLSLLIIFDLCEHVEGIEIRSPCALVKFSTRLTFFKFFHL